MFYLTNEGIDGVKFDRAICYNNIVSTRVVGPVFVFIRYSREVQKNLRYRGINIKGLYYLIHKNLIVRRCCRSIYTRDELGGIELHFAGDDIAWYYFTGKLVQLETINQMLDKAQGEQQEKRGKERHKRDKKKRATIPNGSTLTEQQRTERNKEKRQEQRVDSLLFNTLMRDKLDSSLRTVIKNGIATLPVHKTQEAIRFVSIDIGVKNIATVCSNVFSPFLISGQQMINILKHYEQMYNHAYYGRYRGNAKINKAKRLDKRNELLKEFLIQTCDRIMLTLFEENIDTLIVGYPESWGRKISFESSDMTAMFKRALAKFKEMLRKRCCRHNITFAEVDESHTSIASFIDNEEVKRKNKYMGSRVNRDSYVSSQGYIIHADVNGAYNIAKKYLIKKGVWSDKYFTEMIAMLNNSKFIHAPDVVPEVITHE